MRPWSDHHCQASCSAKVAIAASNQQSPKAPCLGCHEGFWHWIFQAAGQQRQNRNQDAKYLVPLSCKLSSLNTANNFQQVRPNCLQNQKCWMKPFDWALSSRNSYTRVALLRCHANKHSLLSCPGTSTSSNPWFGQKDHMIYHLLGSIWPNKSRPRILTHLIWFILTYDDLSMSSVHRFLMHLWIAICAQLPPALDERACHPFVCRSP